MKDKGLKLAVTCPATMGLCHTATRAIEPHSTSLMASFGPEESEPYRTQIRVGH